jgi:hypothetical protein
MTVDQQQAPGRVVLDNQQSARPLWRRPEVYVLDAEDGTGSGGGPNADHGAPGNSTS